MHGYSTLAYNDIMMHGYSTLAYNDIMMHGYSTLAYNNIMMHGYGILAYNDIMMHGYITLACNEIMMHGNSLYIFPYSLKVYVVNTLYIPNFRILSYTSFTFTFTSLLDEVHHRRTCYSKQRATSFVAEMSNYS